jgi:sulfur-oxidizing protein SoxY
MFLFKRRILIKTVLFACLSALSGSLSKISFAAWTSRDFSSNSYDEVIKQLFNSSSFFETEQLKVKLPQTAENGAVVPIIISSELDNIQRLYIMVEKNPTPLTAEFNFSSELAIYVTTRIKMAESSHVIVIAEQGERLLINRQWVNVVLGGCGTG